MWGGRNVIRRGAEKVLKYKDCTVETERVWTVHTAVIAVMIGGLELCENGWDSTWATDRERAKLRSCRKQPYWAFIYIYLYYSGKCCSKDKCKGKGHPHNRPQRPKGGPGRLRPRIFLTFGTTRVVGRQPHAPAAFTPRGNPSYSFLEAESTPGHMVPSVATENIPSVTPPGIDPETVRLVAQCLNQYATPGPLCKGTVHI
jgi:hypothetical protein